LLDPFGLGLGTGTEHAGIDKYVAVRLIPTDNRTSPDGTAIARSLTDPEAFTDIFDRHFAVVHRYIARRTGRDTADDLAAQTFTLAFAHRGRYRDDLGTARPWLFGIATNLLRAEWRSNERRSVAVERLRDLAAPSSSPTALGDANTFGADDDRLGTALHGLPVEQREALLLHVWGELSYAEVATALEVRVGTIRSRISRACAALRTELEDTNLRRTHDG
jgi:RNA polymerase sigma factor (sigma-70 family)